MLWIHPNEGIYIAQILGIFGGILVANLLGYYAVINKYWFWIIFNQLASSAGLGYYIWIFYNWLKSVTDDSQNWVKDQNLNQWTLINMFILSKFPWVLPGVNLQFG